MADHYFSRVETIDFFSTILPGFFTAMSLGVVFGEYGGAAPDKLLTWMPTSDAGAVAAFSAVSVVLLFASYILGSALRAFQVNRADTICRLLFGPLECILRSLDDHSFEERLYLDKFPYAAALKTAYDNAYHAQESVQQCSSVGSFDCWKAVLRSKEQASFRHIEMLEARARFFAGMFWASLGGLFASSLVVFRQAPVRGAVVALAAAAVIVVLKVLWRYLGSLWPLLVALLPPALIVAILRYTPDEQRTSGWFVAGALVFVISTFVLMALGSRLRFIRGEEAVETYRAYLAHWTTVNRALPAPEQSSHYVVLGGATATFNSMPDPEQFLARSPPEPANNGDSRPSGAGSHRLGVRKRRGRRRRSKNG